MRGTRLALSLTVALLGGGCIDAVTAPDRELPERRGTQVSEADGVDPRAAFAWSADGSAIYYRSSSPAALTVVDVAPGAPIALASADSAYRDIRTSPDGRTLYFVADTGAAAIPVAFRLPPGDGAPVALGRTNDTEAERTADGWAVLPTPRPDTAALIVDPDSVVLDGPELRAFVADGCERLVVFSPDGGRVLCLRNPGATAQYRILDLDGGTLSSITLTAADDEQPLAVAWTAGGILAFVLGNAGFGVYDVTAGTTTTVAPRPGSAYIADATHAALSTDGRYGAYWVHTCVDPGASGECARGQSVLHAVDLITLDDRVAAVATGTSAGNRIAFSPDGSQLAYVFEGTLYRAPLP